MGGATSRARNAAKCARCGHARAKHTTNPADGCTAKIGGTTRDRRGNLRRYARDCPCRYFVESES